MPTKSEITSKIIESTGLDLDLEQALKLWYQNLRPNGGLRLTTYGYKILQSLGIESWSWAWPKDKGYINKDLLLEMDRKLTYPYYINPKTRELVFFSSREAMMTTLYGDIKSWLKCLSYRDISNNNVRS